MQNILCNKIGCQRFGKPLLLAPSYERDILIFCPSCKSSKDKDEHALTLEFLRREKERMLNEAREL